MDAKKRTCSDCGETTRRGFLKTTTALAAAAAVGGPSILRASSADGPEALAKAFHKSLSAEQRKAVAFPWDNPNRMKVMNNWEIVPQQIGKFYTADQQQLVKDIFKGMTSPEGHERFL
ncbi:MAG TPA: twin-arginine translocation signal domain-containing protein, partial [Planctomycetota bacterium]|nr:twin-arginine translocation signal domain-containing protein [Planctomycetota bacterium]